MFTTEGSGPLLIVVAILLVLAIILLWKAHDLKTLGLVFVLLVSSSVILLKYFE
jgi:hypothetical protein